MESHYAENRLPLLCSWEDSHSHRLIVEEHLDDVTKVTCKSELPIGFACAILFNLDPPFVDGIGIASVAGAGTDVAPQSIALISEVSLILNGTLYTAVYDPPLERDEKFSSLRKNVGIPA